MEVPKMKAIVTTKYGGPEVLQLREMPRPVPGEKEILVKITVSSITRADGMMRTGTPYFGRLFMGLTKPKHPVTGTGFAGIVEAAGSGVAQFKKGDRVFGESVFGAGTNAEYTCVPEAGVLMKVPVNLSDEELASVCDGALTSLNFLRGLANIQRGQKVLIIGASGSLGTAAVQLARHFGAKVTGVCSTANVELVRSLGADEVIDYSVMDFTKNGETYDIIYDTVGKSSFGECKESLTQNGTYLSPVLGVSLLFQMLKTSLLGDKKAKFDATGMRPVPYLRELLREIAELMAAGKLKTIIDRRYSLEEVADAHRYVEQGHKRGNVIVAMN